MRTSRFTSRSPALPSDDLCPKLSNKQRRKCPSCQKPMAVARLKKNGNVMWLCPDSGCHQSIAIDQDRYWTHIAKRNERSVVGRYDGPFDAYDSRCGDQPYGAGPAFVRGYAARRPDVKLHKQSEFD
jgi:ribosomal protein L37AE/L43A